MLSLAGAPLRAEADAVAAGGPDPEPEITRKLMDLQVQIDQLKAELDQAKKARAAAAATASVPAAAPSEPAPAAAPAPQEPAATAAATTAPEKPTLKSILAPTTVNGFVDVYYGYNFNHPQNQRTNYRAFDAPDNQFSLNQVQIRLDKSVDASSRLGYRFSFGYGNSMNVINAADAGGIGFGQYMEEAYLTYLAPIGKNGLQVDVGKMVTPHGAEVIESKDNWNYSRGLLYTYAIPFYHFGIRSKYTWNSKVALSGHIVNGWNNVVDNNTGKTYGVTLFLNPSSKVAITQNYMAGPEMAGINQNWRQLADTIVSITATDKLSFTFNYDYGRGDNIGLPEPARWQGIAGYVRYAFDPAHAFTVRYELFDDPTGFTTGTVQQLKEVTATFEKKVSGSLITRLEYRHDYSNQPTYMKGSGTPVKSQDTLAAALIYVFSSND